MPRYRITETIPYAFDLVLTYEVEAPNIDSAEEREFGGIFALIKSEYPDVRIENIDEHASMGMNTEVDEVCTHQALYFDPNGALACHECGHSNVVLEPDEWDIASPASRQHYIDTGTFLKVGEAISATPDDDQEVAP